MIRYFIDPETVAEHICDWIETMEGGEIFVPKMSEQKIMDIAKLICPDCEIEYTGTREMEKIVEVLYSEEEEKIMEEKGGYYVIRPNKVD